jgi:methylmalonyl-CoA mutase
MKKMSGIDSILEVFGGVSKEEWLSKIRKDLGSKAIDEMYWDFDSELKINPFVHAEDIERGLSDIKFEAAWEIAEEFQVIDEEISNEEILDALTGGCEVIMLKVKDIPDWSMLLNGVNLGIIKTYVIPDTQEITQSLIASLDDFLQKLSANIAAPAQSADQVGSAAPVIHIRNDKFIIGGPAHLHPDKTVVEGLAKTISEGIHLITGSYEHHTVECVVEIGDAYFVEIARLRALRILWSNSLAALGLDKPSLFVEGRFSNRDMSEDVHYNMIAAGSKALSAISGGVDRLIIAGSDVHPNSFHRRISRNIHHILRYESKLDTIDDPVKGSYYIENLTRQIVEKAWAKLIEDLR